MGAPKSLFVAAHGPVPPKAANGTSCPRQAFVRLDASPHLGTLRRSVSHMNPRIAFIGGGNMASAILGGLLRQGHEVNRLIVVDPDEPTRARHAAQGIVTLAQADATLADADVVVWAVKPQSFRQAATPVSEHTARALHLSVAAGIRSDSIAAWLGSQRIVRAMPNTPALIGQGISGLFARTGVSAQDRVTIERVLATTGSTIWLADEAQLDAVTALSGSGPAYVFYFLEAMTTAGAEMGLSREHAYQLSLATFRGASLLAEQSGEAPQVLRQRVTSKGGTTHAAIRSMEDNDMRALFIEAIYAARDRARTLGDDYGN
ncbi:MAG: pyrroline-5-carboxylate reductase [Rhodoferax sp.]